MNSLIIIPCYNERNNIQPLIEAILVNHPALDLLVVDDSSPDGTGELVRTLSETHSQVHLLTRPEKKGLGRAYVSGFKWALQRNYDFLIEMDADFSHRPVDLTGLIRAATKGADFVIGSRYVPGGKTVNWSVFRKCISRCGGLYARLILGYPIQDWTGGFNGWKRHVLEGINLENIRSDGYSFQIELKYRASVLGFKGAEVPIIFEERRAGQSKMSSKIVLEAMYRVWLLKLLNSRKRIRGEGLF